MKLDKNIENNKSLLNKELNSQDVIYFSFNVNGTSALAIYLESLTDKELLGEQVIKPLYLLENLSSVKSVTKALTLPECKELYYIKDCTKKIVEGDAVILIDGFSSAFTYGTRPLLSEAGNSMLDACCSSLGRSTSSANLPRLRPLETTRIM